MRLIDADAIQDEYMRYHDGKRIVIVDMAPTVEERKTGKWIYNRWHVWECSVCGGNPTKGMGYVQGHDELYNYCPNCGADMRGE